MSASAAVFAAVSSASPILLPPVLLLGKPVGYPTISSSTSMSTYSVTTSSAAASASTIIAMWGLQPFLYRSYCCIKGRVQTLLPSAPVSSAFVMKPFATNYSAAFILAAHSIATAC